MTAFAPTGQVQLPSEPSEADLLEIHKKGVMLAINCHAIGTIQTFDTTRQVAQISINYKRTQQQYNAVTGSYNPVLIDYPLLLDVPVVCLGGGIGALTFPIVTGDECLVLFNDRDIDNWFSGSSTSAPATPRLHSFSDGIAIVGVRSLAKVLTAYDGTRAVLRGGTAMVGVGGGGGLLVKVANATLSLGTLMQTLLTDIGAMATGTAAEFTAQAGAATGPLAPLAPGFTALAASMTDLSSALTTLATQFSELLE